jgi:hypothetical protein
MNQRNWFSVGTIVVSVWLGHSITVLIFGGGATYEPYWGLKGAMAYGVGLTMISLFIGFVPLFQRRDNKIPAAWRWALTSSAVVQLLIQQPWK